jgi:hypothetical protein
VFTRVTDIGIRNVQKVARSRRPVRRPNKVTTLGGMLAHLIRCLTVSYGFPIAYRMTTQYIIVCVIKSRRSVFATALRTLADRHVTQTGR